MTKDDRKAWDFEENPRDNFATFDNRAIPDSIPDDSKGFFRHLAVRKRLAVVFLGLVGSTFLLGYFWPYTYPYFTVPVIQAALQKYLPTRDSGARKKRQSEVKSAVVENEKIITQPAHREYGKAEIERAKREVLLKRRVEWNKQQVVEKAGREEPTVAVQEEGVAPPSYRYEIELFSGGRISTDNAVMKEDTVSFEDSGGLWISIDKNEVKKMTRTRIEAGNP